MIIRLSVNDNDFSEVINKYFNGFILRMFELHPDLAIPENDFEALRAWRKRESEISRLLNPNNDIKLTEKDKETIINQVIYTFANYVDNNYPEDAEYLKEKLEVSVIDSFTDKWENGEAFYWFQHSNTAINQ